ncbi:MAG: rod-binding protein, partial [Burkholderiaceae bacterium]
MKPLGPLGSLGGMGESAAGLAGDARALADLKRAAQADPKAAARQVAQQFEALFMNMVMKNMREGGPKSELFDSPTRDLAQGMLDQEMAAKMAARGTGLAEMIARQLERQVDPRAGLATPELKPYAPRRPQAPAMPTIGRPADVGAATAASIQAARAMAPA